MLEAIMVNDDDEDLGPLEAQKLETSGIMSYGAKAKTKNFWAHLPSTSAEIWLIRDTHNFYKLTDL